MLLTSFIPPLRGSLSFNKSISSVYATLKNKSVNVFGRHFVFTITVYCHYIGYELNGNRNTNKYLTDADQFNFTCRTAVTRKNCLPRYCAIPRRGKG